MIPDDPTQLGRRWSKRPIFVIFRLGQGEPRLVATHDIAPPSSPPLPARDRFRHRLLPHLLRGEKELTSFDDTWPASFRDV
ncbi:hypothetical protein AAMO2058_000365100 [Amorphochlora amoebiformis]